MVAKYLAAAECVESSKYKLDLREKLDEPS